MNHKSQEATHRYLVKLVTRSSELLSLDWDPVERLDLELAWNNPDLYTAKYFLIKQLKLIFGYVTDTADTVSQLIETTKFIAPLEVLARVSLETGGTACWIADPSCEEKIQLARLVAYLRYGYKSFMGAAHRSKDEHFIASSQALVDQLFDAATTACISAGIIANGERVDLDGGALLKQKMKSPAEVANLLLKASDSLLVAPWSNFYELYSNSTHGDAAAVFKSLVFRYGRGAEDDVIQEYTSRQLVRVAAALSLSLIGPISQISRGIASECTELATFAPRQKLRHNLFFHGI